MSLKSRCKELCRLIDGAIREADEASAKYQTIGRLLRRALTQLAPIAGGREMKPETMSRRYEKGVKYLRVAMLYLREVSTENLRELEKVLLNQP